ncbi:MAG: EthD family reductase [Alphaproteobacteria bacterium]
MSKLILLYKRRPGLDVSEFHGRMRGQTETIEACAGLNRYVQSHTLIQGYRKGELLFDGMGECSFDSLSSARKALSDLEGGIWGGEAGFAEPALTVRMLVDVHVAKAGAVVADAVKNIEFVNRRPGMPLDRFRRYWREVHGPIGARIPGILRYEQNHVHASSYEGLSVPRFDGLAITWFASTAEMRKGAATPEYEITRADEANFLPDGHLPIIITREVVDIGGASGNP